MPNNDFLLSIQSHYHQFTKAEKKVADYVLRNPKKVLFMSITDLADACDVGDTSVFRFCRTMKLRGYQEFKMRLSLSIKTDNKETEELESDVTPDDSFATLAQKVLKSNIDAINETYSLLNPEEFIRCMDYFEAAENVYFFGVGSSMLTAMEAMDKFLRITPKVHCIPDSHMQSMVASMLTEKDLAIIISYSGSTKDSIHVAKTAKQAGAKVICISRFIKSPLTGYADITILCGANESPLQGGSTSAKMCLLYIIDLMYMEYYRRNYDISFENNQKTMSSVLEKLY
ncbi:MAG: MurR/RpiR family transcriptional regulator [Epulopiscium sp.]|jgi:DNA-binding MurR/RpiR family transcriptional regulator|nr:MurR/RpiR family transcriptional regulator [Candidatus Epulonipiscium sp.]HOQ16896.1 MurR/RpiR family transcriptional regulator [Defluviitaleaceae bacterium]HPT75349.1 MurR/RpiR family transcriptional regulator [Defluviitaleaceae bacterium]